MKQITKVKIWQVAVVLFGAILWGVCPAALAEADDGTPPADNVGVSPIQPVQPAITGELVTYPLAVSPGDPITYTLTLSNAGQVDSRVTISVTLPAGFELPLTALPVGASYNLRSGRLNWTGVVMADSMHELVFPGLAPAEPRADGRLTAFVALDNGAHLSAIGWAGALPTAVFTYTAGAPVGRDGISTHAAVLTYTAGAPLQFTNLSRGTGPLSAWWNFGDGTPSTELTPRHSFPAGGEYTVRLTIANPKGASSVVQTITIAPSPEEEPAQHEILVSDDTPAVGQPVYFNSSTPISVTIHWNFGDGGVSDVENPSHNYQQPGVYTVTRVLGEGVTAVQSSRVLVVDHPPQASIQVANPIVSVGQLVTFTAFTSASEVVSYYWDFGDGASASHSYVAHSYGIPGSYPVTLAVNNDFGVALDTLTLRVSQYYVYLPLVLADYATTPPAEPEATAELEPAEEPEPEIIFPADPLAQQMLQAINAEREAAGLPLLTWSDQLVRSAQHHSDDMATHWFTGHYGSNGSRPVDRMRQASYTGDYAGECTAWGFGDIVSAVAWWMTSPPHRVIILSTVATEIGGAYSYNPDAPSVHYWTIDFGAR